MSKWVLGGLVAGFFVLVALALFSDTPSAALLGIAACLSAVSGLVTALTALKRSAIEAQQELLKEREE